MAADTLPQLVAARRRDDADKARQYRCKRKAYDRAKVRVLGAEHSNRLFQTAHFNPFTMSGLVTLSRGCGNGPDRNEQRLHAPERLCRTRSCAACIVNQGSASTHSAMLYISQTGIYRAAS
jgi:hypothetical protein